MPTALSDPSSTLYILLGIVCIILAAVAVRAPSRERITHLGVGMIVLLAVFLIDTFVESPREQAVRKMKAMAEATQNKKMDEAFSHVSEAFKYKNCTKAAIRDRARRAEGEAGFQGVSVAGFDRADFKQVDDKTVEIGFEVWATGYPLPEWRFYCVGRFARDGDGEYRLVGLRFHKAAEGPAGPEIQPPRLDC